MKKVLFLDRDGIINIDHGYVHKSEDFTFMNGIFDVCKHAISLNYLIIVITNQSGIAREYYTEKQFATLSHWMTDEFTQKDIHITDIFYCPHHPDKGIGKYKQSCECRKPKPGLILQAQKKFNVDLINSIFIGDKLSDMSAAKAAGITTKLLLEEKNESLSTKESLIKKTYHSITTIKEAIRYIK